MSDIFETVQANIIPIALSLIVIGVGICLLYTSPSPRD